MGNPPFIGRFPSRRCSNVEIRCFPWCCSGQTCWTNSWVANNLRGNYANVMPKTAMCHWVSYLRWTNMGPGKMAWYMQSTSATNWTNVHWCFITSLESNELIVHFLWMTFWRNANIPSCIIIIIIHNDVMKWKHFPRYWSFVRGIHQSTMNSPPKGQWRGSLMLSLICAWTNGWVNNRDAGDLRRHRAHYDVNVMSYVTWASCRTACSEWHQI